MSLEELRDRGDRRAHPAEQRMPVPGVVAGEGEHLPELPAAVVSQQQQPGVDGAGNGGGERPSAGHQIETLSAEVLDRRVVGRGTLPHEHERLRGVGGGGKDTNEVASRAVQMRLDHMQHESSGGGGIEGIAAALEHRLGGRRRDPVGGGDHAESAAEGRRVVSGSGGVNDVEEVTVCRF